MEADKIQSNNLDGEIGYCYLHITIGNVVLCWLMMLKQKVRLRLGNFKKTWCWTRSPMEAAEKVKRIKQLEKGYMRKYITAFKECKWFFDGQISVSSSNKLF